MSALTKAQRAALAAIGAKGGKAKGKRKARSPEHYRRLADMKRAKAKKEKVDG
jgi:hypothetical protein